MLDSSLDLGRWKLGVGSSAARRATSLLTLALSTELRASSSPPHEAPCPHHARRPRPRRHPLLRPDARFCPALPARRHLPALLHAPRRSARREGLIRCARCHAKV